MKLWDDNHERFRPGVRLVIVIVACAVACVLSVRAYAHQRGCRSTRCDNAVKHYIARQRAKEGDPQTSFDRCVAQHESSGDPRYNDGTYHGLYNFDHDTWRAAGGRRYAYDADGATSRQQTRIFHHWEPSHPWAWPVSVPACGG